VGILAPISTLAANSVYLSQAGGGTGTSCASTLAVSYFNTSGNWSATPTGTQIGPGTTVFLCGASITTNLTFQGSGSAGGSGVCGFAATACTPVTLDGSNLTAMSAFIDPNTSYLVIQNITWGTSYATNSSTQAVIQSNAGSFITIQGNHMDVINSAQLIFMENGVHDILIQNNYLRISTVPSDGFDTDGIDASGAFNVLIQGNTIAMNTGSGDASCGGCHNDLTQVWSSQCGSFTQYTCTHDWTYRYNYFIQESSPSVTNNLSWMIMEEISAGNWNVYGNVFQYISGGTSGNGAVFDGNCGTGSGNPGACGTGTPSAFNIFNNTMVGESGAGNNLLNLSGVGTFTLKNNIVYSTTQGNSCTGGVCTTATRGYNLWFGPASPSCVATELCGHDPLFTNYSAGDYSLQSSSPAKLLGTNLGTSYNTAPVAESTWPNPTVGTRAASGNWDAGAYVASAGGCTGSVTISPTTLSLGTISQGTLSGWSTISITNGTTCVATPTSYTFTGANPSDFLAYSAYNNTGVWAASTAWTQGQFIVDSNGCMETATTPGTGGSTVPAWSSPTCIPGPVTADGGTVKWNSIGTYPNGCGATIAIGVSCNAVVAFKPTTSGSESATLNFNYAGGGTSPATISVSGTGSTAFVSPNLPVAPVQVNLPLKIISTPVTPYLASLNQSLLAPSTTYTVCASGCSYTDANLQAALTQGFSDCQTNNSLVQLFNTETVTLNISLGGLNIGNGTNGCAAGKYLRFETNHPELLPADGVRVNHSYCSAMPQIVVGTSTGYAVQLGHNMSGFEMRGICFSNANTYVTQTQQTFRCSDELVTATASIPKNVIIDQSVFWAGGPTGNLSHTAILAECNNMAIINSDIENYQYTTNDNQAINMFCSNGPGLVSNNTLSATTENTMIGGLGCAITDGGLSGNPFPNPANWTFASNYIYKPLRWRVLTCGAVTGNCGAGFSFVTLTPQPTTSACTGSQCQVNVSFFAASQRPDMHPYDNALIANCANTLFNGTFPVLASPLPTNSVNPFTFSVINTALNSTNAPNGTTTTGCTISGFYDPQWVPPGDGAFNYTVKDCVEQKQGVNVLYIGNWIGPCWQGGQSEMLIFQEGNPVLATTNYAPWDATGNIRITTNTWDDADINGYGLEMWTAFNPVVNGSGVGSSLGTNGPIEADNNMVYALGPEFTFYEEWLSHSGTATPLANGQLQDLFVNHNDIFQASVNTALSTFDLVQFASPNNLQPGQTPFLRAAADNNIIDFGQVANGSVAFPYGSQKCEINSGLAVPCWAPAEWAANIPIGTIAGSTAPYGCTTANSVATFQPNAGPAGVGSTWCPTANLSAIGLANTTINTASSPISPGIVTVTPASMANITAPGLLFVGSATNAEYVPVISTTGTTFTALFQNAHTSQITTVFGTTPPVGSIAHLNGTDGLDVGANAAAVALMTSWVPSGVPPTISHLAPAPAIFAETK
jgi:hypothetical protein